MLLNRMSPYGRYDEHDSPEKPIEKDQVLRKKHCRPFAALVVNETRSWVARSIQNPAICTVNWRCPLFMSYEASIVEYFHVSEYLTRFVFVVS